MSDLVKRKSGEKLVLFYQDSECLFEEGHSALAMEISTAPLKISRVGIELAREMSTPNTSNVTVGAWSGGCEQTNRRTSK